MTPYNLHLTFCCIIGVECFPCIPFFEVASLTKLQYDNTFHVCCLPRWAMTCKFCSYKPRGAIRINHFCGSMRLNGSTRISTAPLRFVKNDENLYCFIEFELYNNSLNLRAKAPDMKMVGRWSFLFEMAYSLEVQNSFKKSPSWKESSYLSNHHLFRGYVKRWGCIFIG